MAEGPKRMVVKPDGRKVIQVAIRMDVDAYELMQQFSPTKRAHGHFLSRLVYEHALRTQARANGHHGDAGEGHAA